MYDGNTTTRLYGMAGTFLEDGDSGALISFLDDDQVKQAFAYGVCEVDTPHPEEPVSSDEDPSEDSSEPGSSDQNSSSSDDADDSEEEFVIFCDEGPKAEMSLPSFIALDLKKGLQNLGLFDNGCFSECGNTR